VRRYRLEKTEPFIGEGHPRFNAVCRLGLEGIVAKRMGRPLRPGNDLVQDSQSDVFSERRSGRVIRETSGIGVNVRKWQNIDPVDRSELLQQFRVPIVKTDNLGELRPITGLVLNYLSPDFYAAE